MGVDRSVVQHFATILNYDVMKLPFKYLGMLVEGCHKRGVFWDGVLEKIKSILGRWKGRVLSMVGRIILIKSVISSIPLFYVSLYKLPTLMLKKIVKLQRNFLWGWDSEGIKITWISSEKVCKPRKTGDLGILDLRLFNVALLGKWIWHLRSNKGSLWKEIPESKYGGWRCLKAQRNVYKQSYGGEI